MAKTQTNSKMHLKVTVAGEVKEFDSTIAETILEQIKKVVVGHDQIHYFDVNDNKYKSFTYCCGDKYEYNFNKTETPLKETELDCCGFPITYEGDK